MASKNGNLSINSENIFPIIKKWLYSDSDIFYRELISNGCDAITKLKKLEAVGEYEFADGYQPRILVTTDAEKKTITVEDNGIGMTFEEVDKFINQIAFSGAADFLDKYKDKTNDDQIIGHFGLGFYSAFMVADEVEIDTLSYLPDATPVHWNCDGGTEFAMKEGTRTEVGTKITLHLAEDETKFCNEWEARRIIEKYCSFMPVEIYLNYEQEAERLSKDYEEKKAKAKEDEEVTLELPKPINDPKPLWTKHPNDCTEEEYKEFYRHVFHDYREPLFWIHLNMDYPFNLKGILYFPKINIEYESVEGTIKLYNNQVFIADNIKEVIPEYLLLLKGVIDCPDLPLNVSRSALQNDGFVNKISDYISKKVADKLSGMCKTDRENYEKYWDDIHPFIKYGCIRDGKFFDRMSDFVLYKDLDGKYQTIKELAPEEEKTEEEKAENNDSTVVDENGEEVETEEKEPANTIYYVTDETTQSQYIKMFKDAGMNAVLMKASIDIPFMQNMEMRRQDVKFQRIDADLSDVFKDETVEEAGDITEKLTELFKKALDNENLKVTVDKLKNDKVAAMVTMSEESRRMQDMMMMYGMGDGGTNNQDLTLVLNTNHPLVQYLTEHPEKENNDLICKQLYDLALLSHHPLSPEEMSAFVERSNEVLQILAEK
ncbi:MAG: molecular chaperone HtpG [Lachnospiraceae bacterium]|nr:molecular chaperone HtpG [Lachnospiraceae bacterium]